MSDLSTSDALEGDTGERIRVRGLVQGVGFRPTVWRLARHHGLRGSVANDGGGVDIHVCGTAGAIGAFVDGLRSEAPPLSRIEQVERTPAALLPRDAPFVILSSRASEVQTGIVPDAATCRDCLREIFDPRERRYRYPFANCTHCGPRLSMIEAIPYDRANTTMRSFDLCAACAAEYRDPSDRRFHAQPVACAACGPRAWLMRAVGGEQDEATLDARDDVEAAAVLLSRGSIVAVKGLGGFQLACDATDERAVARLRALKRRASKPLALMARDLDVIREHCAVPGEAAVVLTSAAAPVVILDALPGNGVARDVAPGLSTLGFMLPNTPLHHLLLHTLGRPIVLTSGNLSDEPQCIANDEAVSRLGGIADYFLLHDRDIARRVDDSVVRMVRGAPLVLRRARGLAPAPLAMPPGFEPCPPVLALGGELKNTFCLLRGGQAILSHHMGDLENAPTFADYTRSLGQYRSLVEHTPRVIAVDRHPEYLSSKLGRQMARDGDVQLTEVQHHHAHIAACMVEQGVPLGAAPAIGIALDGLGFGDDATLWGGEFLLADYRSFRRLATFKPVAMPGGAQAIREPWRNTYAHLLAAMGWEAFAAAYGGTDLHRFLLTKPRDLLDGMIARAVNSPLASSCGRLFDAVAAAAGVCRERAQDQGQAAAEFEALVDPCARHGDAQAYPFAIARCEPAGLPCLEPRPMWRALLDDVIAGTTLPVIAARFHKGLAVAITRMVDRVRRCDAGAAGSDVVVLSGGVFQNRILTEQLTARLEDLGLRVLTHRAIPANDGGLALGQAAIAAANSS